MTFNRVLLWWKNWPRWKLRMGSWSGLLLKNGSSALAWTEIILQKQFRCFRLKSATSWTHLRKLCILLRNLNNLINRVMTFNKGLVMALQYIKRSINLSKPRILKRQNQLCPNNSNVKLSIMFLTPCERFHQSTHKLITVHLPIYAAKTPHKQFLK